jgi:hypothetical protein
MTWRSLSCGLAAASLVVAGVVLAPNWLTAQSRRTTKEDPLKAEQSQPAKGEVKMETNGKCPVMGHVSPASGRHTAAGALSNADWWPNQLNLRILHQNSPMGNPLGEDFRLRCGVSNPRSGSVKQDQAS